MTRPGGPADLELGELPTPVPGPGEVLVRVATISASRQDVYTLAGRANIARMAYPHVAGNDPAGVVAALGEGVASVAGVAANASDGAVATDLAVGRRVVTKALIACGVCATCRAGEDEACPAFVSLGVGRWGGFAEYVSVPATNVFPIPDGIGFAEATALSQSVPVALTLLRKRAGLTAGDTVLVTSASGAIGSACVQVALRAGARVVAAVGGAANAAYARELGAEAVIDYAETPAFAPLVTAAVQGGVSLYVESAGSPATWAEALRAVGRRGRVVVCGSHAGPVVEMDLNWLFRNRISILGSSGSSRAAFAEAIGLVADGSVRTNIDSVRPWTEWVAAFERLGDRGHRGKVILEVWRP